MIDRRNLAAAAAGLAPFACVWIVKVLVRPRPFWIAYGDPEMFFFYDGLRLLRGTTPANIDHPGTPTQLVAAAVASVTGPTPLAIDRYRLGMYVVAALLAVAATWLLVRGRVLRGLPWSQQVAVLWSFWFAPAALRHVAIASPEAMEFAFGALAITALLSFDGEHTPRRAAALGAAIGAAVSLKFVFLSWLLAAGLATLLYGGRTFRHRVLNAATLAAAAAFAFAASTAAAAPRWPDMFRWLSALSLHTNWYGQGSAASPPMVGSLRALTIAFAAAKAWHLWLVLVLTMLLIGWCRSRRELALVSVFCVVAVVLNFASAARGVVPTAAQGYGDIRYRYLLPCAIVAMLALASALRRRILAMPLLNVILLVTTGAAVAKGTVAELKTHTAIIETTQQHRAALDAAMRSLRRPGDVVVYAYTPEPSFVLRFATYDRRFMMVNLLQGDPGATSGPAFNVDFLRMIEHRYPDDGHFWAGIISLPAARTHWDLFVRREDDVDGARLAPGVVAGRASGYAIIRNIAR